MAAQTKLKVPRTILNDIAALKQRVSWLEAALKPKPSKPPVDRLWANFERGMAESKARSDAMSEYYKKQREDRWRENPSSLRNANEIERSENEFLKSKGLKPNPSWIPKELRKRR